jgi:hypothetical protein
MRPGALRPASLVPGLPRRCIERRRGLRIAKRGAALALLGLLAMAALRLVPALAGRGFTCRDETTAARRHDSGIGRLTICSRAVQESFAQLRGVHASLRTDEHGTIVAVVANMTRPTL